MRRAMLVFALVVGVGFGGMQIQHANRVVQLSTGAEAADGKKDKAPEACPVTKPPVQAFVPPGTLSQGYGPDGFWIGTSTFWTGLRRNGIWKDLPQWPDGSFRQKLLWWHEGYDARRDPQPNLKVRGKRLDAPAPPMHAEVSNGWTDGPEHAFITTGINLPSHGCWEITGKLEDADISFVVWVE